MKIRSLIIDDDSFIIDLLSDKLQQFIPEVTLIQTANSGNEGIQLIREHRPDLIFLDVEMGDMTGFEMLALLPQIPFQTIFITSYSHYAIKAIRFNALDYLVKPINLEELKAAIARYKKRSLTNQPDQNIQQAIANFKTNTIANQVLTLPTQDGELRMPLKDIIRVEGERNYSYFHLTQNRKKLSSRPLGDLEELLSDKDFFRCHKSHLINQVHVKGHQHFNAVVLSNQKEVPVARRRKAAFREWYLSFSE